MHTSTTRTALDAFVEKQAEAHQLLQALTAKLAQYHDRVAPEDITWGHVGDITHICQKLHELVDEEN